MKSVPTQATIGSTRRDEQELRDAEFAMRLSLMVGLAMLIGKTTVYFITHSAAIFSDAAESVVHVIAVGFACIRGILGTARGSLQHEKIPRNKAPTRQFVRFPECLAPSLATDRSVSSSVLFRQKQRGSGPVSLGDDP